MGLQIKQFGLKLRVRLLQLLTLAAAISRVMCTALQARSLALLSLRVQLQEPVASPLASPQSSSLLVWQQQKQPLVAAAVASARILEKRWMTGAA